MVEIVGALPICPLHHPTLIENSRSPIMIKNYRDKPGRVYLTDPVRIVTKYLQLKLLKVSALQKYAMPILIHMTMGL